MSFFDILGSIFEKWPMTDLTKVIVSMCLVSYNFCMIPLVLTVTFGLNLSGAWGERCVMFQHLPLVAANTNHYWSQYNIASGLVACDTAPHISPPRPLSVTRSHGDIVSRRDWPHGCSSSHHCSSASAQTFHKILRGDHPSAALTTQSRDRRPPGPPPRRNNYGGAALCGSRYSVGHISRLGNRNQLRNFISTLPTHTYDHVHVHESYYLWNFEYSFLYQLGVNLSSGL